MCHGFSAAVGKAGALVAGVVFAMVDNRVKFWISAFCGLAGGLTACWVSGVRLTPLSEGVGCAVSSSGSVPSAVWPVSG